jgi:hypothetical protein
MLPVIILEVSLWGVILLLNKLPIEGWPKSLMELSARGGWLGLK